MSAATRDDFPLSVKRVLAERVGLLCSSPGCRQPTSAPNTNPNSSTSIGVAAHITAAAPGGPRFNPALTREERRAAANGIWLCQNCGRLIDTDGPAYDEQKLLAWKADAEALQETRVARPREGVDSAQASVNKGGGGVLSKPERARRRIASIAAGNTLVVHYSCLDLRDETSGPAMVTGIVVRSLETGITKSFTIGLEGEQAGRLPKDVVANPEALERKMLSSFFSYVAEHPGALWLTWKMLGVTFGFPALAHRHLLYGGAGTVPDDSMVYDLYGILKDRYGPNFVGHPRLKRLVELNDDITVMDLLPGEDEILAFRAGEFDKLRRSTERKTAIIRELFERLEAGTLRTNADLESDAEAVRWEKARRESGQAHRTSGARGSAPGTTSSGENKQADNEDVAGLRAENGLQASDKPADEQNQRKAQETTANKGRDVDPHCASASSRAPDRKSSVPAPSASRPRPTSADDTKGPREAPSARRVVVVTALDVEFCAVRQLLSSVRREAHPTGTIYDVGRYEGWEVAVVEAGAGQSRASFETERAIQYFSPGFVVFVGVAGGIKDVSVGDVVVASKVYGYESGKDEAEFRPRPDGGEPSYPALQAARGVARDMRSEGAGFQVFIKPIAAGEKVVASRESETAKLIRKFYGDTVAVEMEGRGFVLAASARVGVNFVVIRGISDLLEGKAASDAAGSQERASTNAASVLARLLEELGRVEA